MLKKVLNSLGIFLAVFAVFWIVTGSTIEFHQVYVFHSHVDLWQVQTTKTVGKDLKKCFRVLGNNPYTPFNSGILNQSRTNEFGLVALNLSERTIFSRCLYDLITSEYNYDKTLRGPPAA